MNIMELFESSPPNFHMFGILRVRRLCHGITDQLLEEFEK